LVSKEDVGFMAERRLKQWVTQAVLAVATVMATTPRVQAQTTPQGPNEWLCDASYQDCRAPLIQLIQTETVGIDVAFWFMQDARFATEIIRRWQAGVPVRVLVDPKANPVYPGNDQILADLAAAGIPMRQRNATAPGILHWKMMLFAGQNIVEFSGANFSPIAFVPQQAYADYEDETIYFSDDSAVVQSFMTEYDNHWIETQYYSNYANLPNPPARVYPIFPKDPALNFPQAEDYALRLLKRYPKEMQGIDVIMYRITDERQTNALITAMQRGIPVRVISDMKEYRFPNRQWVSYNLDKMWASGIPLRVRGHLGLNHQKLVLFYRNQPATGPAGPLAVFGSSNWTTPSANQQQEHNYFTLKPWIFDYFENQFLRKWCSGNWTMGMPDYCAGRVNPAGAVETTDFVPQAADKPINLLPANAAINLNTTGNVLKWDPGFFGQIYDIYFGQDPNPPLFAADVKLGPVDYDRPKTKKTFTLPTLQTGTTYYWRIVTKTMAGLVSKGPVWSFTTKGTPPMPPPPPPGAVTQVIWAKDVPGQAVVGNWQFINDPTAAGGYALWNPDKGKSKISPALASPVSYFETTFSAMAGVPYHLWIRMRAQGNSLANDSVSVQFNDSVDGFHSPHYRIGEASGAEVVQQDGPSGTISGWGWGDNGFGNFGPDIYFATTGTHTIRVQVRTDGTILDQIVLSPDTWVRTSPGAVQNDTTILGSTISGAPGGGAPPLPSPWQRGDVGTVSINGLASYDDATATFTLIGDAGDIWGTADGMYFAYQPLTGDGSIVARVTGVDNTNVWARGGVMIRESMAASSTNAFMYWAAGKVLAFQRRPTTGATTFATLGASNVLAPRWVRLDRAGDVFTAYHSIDGLTWVYVGSDTIPMGATVSIGLAAASANPTRTATAAFDSVTVTPGTPTPPVPPPPPPSLPDGWSDAGIGAVGFTGGTSFDVPSGTFTVKGAGNDVWGTADAFHYAYRALNGDGFIVARLRSLQNTSSSAKAGVMIRESLAAGAANAFMLVTQGKGTDFQRRQATGAQTVNQVGTATAKAPYWVKLERIGNTFNAYESLDGATWTLIGTDAIPMGTSVYIGLAAVSHNVMATTAAAFDFVSGSW
jgi:phosphatidylserine/phosphatidylglycerophosphate/cardiolipin synthase-like enzyme/regulation of enolase protein 1 (concanavalin A-like superfamily)